MTSEARVLASKAAVKVTGRRGLDRNAMAGQHEVPRWRRTRSRTKRPPRSARGFAAPSLRRLSLPAPARRSVTKSRCPPGHMLATPSSSMAQMACSTCPRSSTRCPVAACVSGVVGRPQNCTGPTQVLLSNPTQLTGFSVSVFWPYGHLPARRPLSSLRPILRSAARRS